MALYFFHWNGIEDDEGEEFATRREAIVAAKQSARELAAHREPAHLHRHVMRVTDGAGEEIASLKLDDYRNAFLS
jgi:hypothetical protein